MSNMSALNSVHNFYLTTYAPKTNSPFDTHKKSELRNVYNSIVKLNKFRYAKNLYFFASFFISEIENACTKKLMTNRQRAIISDNLSI